MQDRNSSEAAGGGWECVVGALTRPQWPGRRRETDSFPTRCLQCPVISHLGYRIGLASKTGAFSGNPVFLHPTTYVRIHERNRLGFYFVHLNVLCPFQNMLLPSIFFPLKSWRHIWELEKCELALGTNLYKCSTWKMHLDDWVSNRALQAPDMF